MADKKITELTELSSASLADIFAVVDIAGSETKKITNESYITNVRNHESPLTASGVIISDNLVPKFPSGSNLGTAEKPFAELFLQSGSIHVESDTPGDPSAVISNVSGNLEISVGGMLLVEQDASFIAPTGSFSYLSGSLNHIGSAERLGDTIITGSVDITGSFEADLTNEHVWIGDENNRNTEISASALATYLTESFITPEQTGSFINTTYGLFNQTGSSIPITGSTAELNLLDGGVGTLSVPANGFTKGDAYHAILTGVSHFHNNDTLRIKIKAGSVILADTGNITLTGAINQRWKMEVYFSIREVGAAGVASIFTAGTFMYTKDASSDFQGINFGTENSTTFNTTIDNTLGITAQFNNVQNGIFSHIFTLNKTY